MKGEGYQVKSSGNASDNRPESAVTKTFGLFVLTAIAEIVGCYLPYLWVKQGHSVWLLVPAA